MTDRLRICKIAGMEFPAGIPVTFQGNEVGKTIRDNQIVIHNDVVHSLLRDDKAKFSLEVLRK
jgi:hypothetical protein